MGLVATSVVHWIYYVIQVYNFCGRFQSPTLTHTVQWRKFISVLTVFFTVFQFYFFFGSYWCVKKYNNNFSDAFEFRRSVIQRTWTHHICRVCSKIKLFVSSFFSLSIRINRKIVYRNVGEISWILCFIGHLQCRTGKLIFFFSCISIKRNSIMQKLMSF